MPPAKNKRRFQFPAAADLRAVLLLSTNNTRCFTEIWSMRKDKSDRGELHGPFGSYLTAARLGPFRSRWVV